MANTTSQARIICLNNKSTKLNATQLGLPQLAAALNWQLSHVAVVRNMREIPIVSCRPPQLDEDTIDFYDHASQEGALGDHYQDDDGRIIREVFIDPIISAPEGRINQGANSVSACASHELLEALFNPFVDRWLDMPDGTDTPDEACDAVENDSYIAPGNVSVSNFLLPSWGDSHPQTALSTWGNQPPPPSAKFDYLGKLTAPFTMSPGGYLVIRSEPGKESEVFNKTHADNRQLLGDHPKNGKRYHILFGEKAPEYKRIAKALKLAAKFGLQT